MIEEARGGLDIHDVALAGIHETHKVSDLDFANGISTEEVERIVGFLTRAQERAGAPRQPSAPGPLDLVYRDLLGHV
jgi:hypothetical protein